MEFNEKKIRILEVAEKLFAENGFKGTSVRAIARGADINVAMISYYFGSKRNLLQELTFFRSFDFQQEVKSILSGNETYLDKVDLLVTFIIRRIHRNRRIYKITITEYAKESSKGEFEHYIAQRKRNSKLIEAFIEEGQAADIFSKSINKTLVLTTIKGTYFSFYHNKKLLGQQDHPEEKTNINAFVENKLIPHIQQSTKALLTYEK